MTGFDANEHLTPFRDARGYGAILFDRTQLRQPDPAWFSPQHWGEAAQPVAEGGRGGAWFIQTGEGDAVLRQLAHTLQDAVRNDDLVCRLGGDEFLIICAHTPLQGAWLTAQKVCREVSALRVPAGSGYWLGSISVGVAARQGDMTGFEALLKAADESVYVAKANGRQCVASVQTVA